LLWWFVGAFLVILFGANLFFLAFARGRIRNAGQTANEK